MRRLIIILFLLCSLTGCATVQFQRTPLVLIGDVDPIFLRDKFADLSALNFEMINSVSFYFKYQGFAGIGYTTVDTKSDTFAVACLNPAGIKIFEVKGSKDSVEEVFFSEQFKKYGDAAQAVAKDIRRIYFNRIPETNADVQKKKREIIFTEPFAEGNIAYIFGGAEKYLIEKRYREKGRRVWTIYYADYREKKGKVHPWRIMFEHHEYGYKLIVKTKEINI